MKKISIMLIIVILLVNINIIVFADDEDEIIDKENIQEVLEASTTPTKELKINSRAAIIYDRTSKTVLWGKEENTKRAMASTTKIMTSIVVLENANLTDTVTISKKAANTGGSRLKINTNDKITVNDLLYGLMLRSGNDAAVALAEYVGGSIEGFADLMNKKAEELNLKNTHFVTPHGLDSDTHYTTAYELALITDYALQNTKFANIVNTKTTTINVNSVPRTITNTNELLGNLDGVNGVKTGFTNNAQRCLVTSTTRNSHQIICVVLGADTKKIRTQDSVKLIEYAFKNYEYINLKEKMISEFNNYSFDDIVINKGIEILPELQMEKLEIEELPINKEEVKNIEVSIEYEKELEAPIVQNQKIGKIEVKLGEKLLYSTNIIIKNEIPKKNILDNIKNMLKHYAYYLENNI